MGQRLVLTIKRNDKRLAAIYYHWSGYTYSAIKEVAYLYHACLKEADKLSDEELQIALIHALENNVPEKDVVTEFFKQINPGRLEEHGGIDSEDIQYVQARFLNETFILTNINRNNGLIALSEKVMDSLEEYSEFDVTINLTNGMVHNECVNFFLEEELEMYLSYYGDIDVKNIQELFIDGKPADIGDFNLVDVDKMLLALFKADHFVRCEDGIYEIIE